MKMHPIEMLAAVVVVLGVLTLGTIGVMFFAGGDEANAPPAAPTVPADVRESAEMRAGTYCTLDGVVPGMTSLYDDAYLNCVEIETEQNIAEWKANQ